MRLLSTISFLLLILCTQNLQAIDPVNSLPIPSKIQFAGQTIPLDRYDMRERFDREQTIITYQHSTSLLLIKRANKYLPIIEPILKKNTNLKKVNEQIFQLIYIQRLPMNILNVIE